MELFRPNLNLTLNRVTQTAVGNLETTPKTSTASLERGVASVRFMVEHKASGS